MKEWLKKANIDGFTNGDALTTIIILTLGFGIVFILLLLK